MKQVVLIFGESSYDCMAVAEIVRPFISAEIILKPQKTPQVFMSKEVARGKTISNAERIARVVAAQAVKDRIKAVVVHKDCDACEPAHKPLAVTIRQYMKSVGIVRCAPAVAAWETESWLMLFPEALAAYRPCWKKLRLGKRKVGQIENSKEFLIRQLRSDLRKCRDYRESDAPGIGRKAREMNLIESSRVGTAESLKEFIDDLLAVIAA